MDEIEVECAKPGRFHAYRGGTVELDEGALRDLAAGFDATQSHKLKVGHESGTAAPAYGRVTSLRWDSFKKRLFATIRPVAELARWIRESRFPDRSMELGREAGRLVFRHLAFLGNAEPAIGGLAPVAMATVENLGAAQVVYLSEDTVDLSQFELTQADRRGASPASLAVHDLVIEELRRAASEGERLDYSGALDRVARDPANRRALDRWVGV